MNKTDGNFQDFEQRRFLTLQKTVGLCNMCVRHTMYEIQLGRQSSFKVGRCFACQRTANALNNYHLSFPTGRSLSPDVSTYLDFYNSWTEMKRGGDVL